MWWKICLLLLGLLCTFIGSTLLWWFTACEKTDKAILIMERRLTEEKLRSIGTNKGYDIEWARQNMALADAEESVRKNSERRRRAFLILTIGCLLDIVAVLLLVL